MKIIKSTKMALISSVTSLFLCCAMLAGNTFAFFSYIYKDLDALEFTLEYPPKEEPSVASEEENADNDKSEDDKSTDDNLEYDTESNTDSIDEDLKDEDESVEDLESDLEEEIEQEIEISNDDING